MNAFYCLAASLFLVVAVRGAHGVSLTPLSPFGLECDAVASPQGSTNQEPVLAWKSESSSREKLQSAYRILVASSREMLAEDRGDCWDSGEVKSDRQHGIKYAGTPLTSNTEYFWKVRVWDEKGVASAWSPTAEWSTGLFAKTDWKASWIGVEAVFPDRINARSPGFLKGAQWIGFTGDTLPEHLAFVRTFVLPASRPTGTARLIATATGTFDVLVNGRKVTGNNDPGEWRRARYVEVTSALVSGLNRIELRFVKPELPRPAALLELSVDDHVVLQSDADWQAVKGEDSAAAAATVVGRYGDSPWGAVTLNYENEYLPPAAYLRKTFVLKKPLKRATAFATARGLYVLYLNGERVGEDLLSPGWTNYNDRIHVQRYDVTGQLKPGGNAIGAILADGWYAGYVGCKGQRSYYNTVTQFLGQLMLEYTDGTRETVGTDGSWRCADGEIREADLLRGVTVNAAKARPGWDRASFDASAWLPVSVAPLDETRLEGHPGNPVRVIKHFAARAVSSPEPGVYVFNLGQNFAGFVRLRVKAKAGDRLRLRYAERLTPEGKLYTANLRTARATDTLLCAHDGAVDWTPEFTFHGFQYVELTGVRETPTLDAIEGLAISSDTPVVGAFSSSSPQLNQLWSNIYWTQRMNFIDIPTDCPQRDERQGWTGDAQVYVRAATLNTEVDAFFHKWLQDLNDEQFPSGEYPCTAPLPFFGGGGAAWGDAGIICPWTIYDIYDDAEIIRAHYDAMVRYIENRRTWFSADMRLVGGGCIGDWLNIDDDTPRDVLVLCYTAHSFELMANMARVMGKAQDAVRFGEWFRQAKLTFNRDFVDDRGRIKGDTQCAYALGLSFGLLDAPNAAKAGARLVELIEARHRHLSTGFLGTRHLMFALSQIGRDDLAYQLLNNDTFPSWGFSIKNGATTIWERWNGWTPESGFFDPSMNSFAHYSFGAVYEWMIERIAGIRSLSPGYKTFEIAPVPGGGLTHASASVTSIYGKISSAWKQDADGFHLDVSVPVNCRATIRMPVEAGSILESGQPFDAGASAGQSASAASTAFEVGSGDYHFWVKPREAMPGRSPALLAPERTSKASRL